MQFVCNFSTVYQKVTLRLKIYYFWKRETISTNYMTIFVDCKLLKFSTPIWKPIKMFSKVQIWMSYSPTFWRKYFHSCTNCITTEKPYDKPWISYTSKWTASPTAQFYTTIAIHLTQYTNFSETKQILCNRYLNGNFQDNSKCL